MMLTIKVLGSGCPNCVHLERIVRRVIETKGIEANVEKVTDIAQIMRYPILSTPGLVIDEKLVSAGRIPQETEIVNWLELAKAQKQ
jgi:small redox-active disulfide protein 2